MPEELPEIVVEEDRVDPAPPLAPGQQIGPQLPPPTPYPPREMGPREIAALEVRNRLFTEWTSVRVEQRYAEAFPTFQFECTEESPIPLIYDALQFIPGDVVRVFIGGVSVIFGYIQERHVAYDAKNHAVRLVGVGDTFDLVNSMVPLNNLNGHDGQSWTALAQSLAAHLNIRIHNYGAVDNTPFQKIAIQPGERIMSVLERYARMRNIVIGSRANGGLLAIGEHPALSTGTLIEGVNILRANAVVRDPNIYRAYFTVGQNVGSDQTNGDAANKMVYFLPGTSPRNRHNVQVADIADTMHGVMRRTMMEKVFSEGHFVEAQITVQGWFKDFNRSNHIWYAGEYYTIDSPSLILQNKVLGCAGCVYEQNENGTTTTLSMVNPIHMNGQFNLRNESLAYQAARREQYAREFEEARMRADYAAQAAAEEEAQRVIQEQELGGGNEPE